MPGRVWSRLKRERCPGCGTERGAPSRKPELTHAWCQAPDAWFHPWPDLIPTKATDVVVIHATTPLTDEEFEVHPG